MTASIGRLRDDGDGAVGGDRSRLEDVFKGGGFLIGVQEKRLATCMPQRIQSDVIGKTLFQLQLVARLDLDLFQEQLHRSDLVREGRAGIVAF